MIKSNYIELSSNIIINLDEICYIIPSEFNNENFIICFINKDTIEVSYEDYLHIRNQLKKIGNSYYISY